VPLPPPTVIIRAVTVGRDVVVPTLNVVKTEAARSVHSAPMTRIAIGADHAGYPLKDHVVALLQASGHEVQDHGTHSTESVDYPPICAGVGRAVRDGEAEVGIVIGGSGQGEQLAANKVRGVRAALCNDLYTARLAREHNAANVLSIGGRVVGFGLAEEIVALFLATAFEGGRHARRVAMLSALEDEF
jgi:ribose 5-phosphate isomerase B